jgi:ABC-type multidrug transport system ATPase subunit
VDELIDRVQLREKRRTYVRDLSGGQRQRLSVACALAGSPDILFLDEPTTGLDPQSRRALWDVCEAFRAAGGTILLTTHFMDEAEKLADRVAIMDHGEILVEGTPGRADRHPRRRLRHRVRAHGAGGGTSAEGDAGGPARRSRRPTAVAGCSPPTSCIAPSPR